jgi:hypothetical protein
MIKEVIMMKVHHQASSSHPRQDDPRANRAVTPGTCHGIFWHPFLSSFLPCSRSSRRFLFIQINNLPNQRFIKKEKL